MPLLPILLPYSTPGQSLGVGSRRIGGPALAGCMVAWLSGLAFQLSLPEWPPGRVTSTGATGAWLLCAFAGLGLALALAWGRRWSRVLAGCAMAGALGFGWAGWQASTRLSQALPARMEGRDMVLQGVITEMPQESVAGVRFRFEPDDESSGLAWPREVPRRLSLGWYRGWAEEGGGASVPRLSAGQRWRLPVRLRRPHGLANPHGFDQELWMFEQGLRASGSVRGAAGAASQGPLLLENTWRHPVERLRQAVRDAIFARVADARAAGVLAALAVGDQSSIDREDWEVFRRTGTAHAVAISGVHITMLAGLAQLAFGWLWRRHAGLVMRWPAPTAARWAGVVVALVYSVFSGWGVPAQRTVVMLAFAALLRSLSLRWPWPLVLMGAAVAVTVFDPWALLQAGFWLSFAAVGLLMASEPIREAGSLDSVEPTLLPTEPPRPGPRARHSADAGSGAAVVSASAWPLAGGSIGQSFGQSIRRATKSGFRSQCLASVGLAPLALVFFQQVSVVGLLANLAALPFITLVITPLALLGIVVPQLWVLGGWAVQGLSAGLQTLSAWSGAVWSVAAAPPWAAWAGLLGALLALSPWPWRVRVLAIPLALPLAWPVVARPPIGGFDVVAVDVGQGTAVIVRTRHYVLVYDAGPQYSPESDAGQRVLAPLLRARGESRVDLLVLSHGDIDHIGGAASLTDAVDVQAVTSSLGAGHPLLLRASLAHARKEPCQEGQRWLWDGVRFEMLHPAPMAPAGPAPFATLASSAGSAKGDKPDKPAKPNARSCVLKVAGEGRSVLLTGDIEAAQEASLAARRRNDLPADVLLVPHHGSRTSSTGPFLAAVSPQVAVVQSGYLNRFGHPAPDVVSRYRALGIDVRTTVACGAWSWLAGEPRPQCERALHPRYWQWRP